MSDWQPIETAPKDGTTVILFIPDLGVPLQLGYWIDSERREHGKIISHRVGWGFPNLWMLGTKHAEPTHWLALPTPPDAETK